MDTMFGCRHSRYSFPMTIRAGSLRATTATRTGTYVVCLDCGREFGYNWQDMKVVAPRPTGTLATIGAPARKSTPTLVTKEAA
jgi:hypothetical protein